MGDHAKTATESLVKFIAVRDAAARKNGGSYESIQIENSVHTGSGSSVHHD